MTNFEMIKKTFDEFQNRLFEARVLPHGKNKSVLTAHFDNAENLIEQIKLNELKNIPIYMTVNEINPNAECIGELNKFHKAKKTISDKDIVGYSKIHIDFDPKKADAHSQATEQEVAYAKAKMETVYKYLLEHDFPEGIVSFSGNGFNLDFYTNLPNTDEVKKTIKSFLKTLSDNFSDEHVSIDTTTYNPSRIIKMYGCISAKGENTPERPYRTTAILSVPQTKVLVTLEMLQDYINKYSNNNADTAKTSDRKTAKANDKKKLTAKIADVSKWLDSYDISYSIKEEEYDGKEATMYILEECVFTEHDNPNCSFLVQFSDSNVFYKCHHDHCNYTIHDFLSKYPVQKQPILLDSKNTKASIYNSVLLNSQFIISDDNKKYVMRNDTRELMLFDSDEFDNFILEQAQALNEIISSAATKTIKDNLRTNYKNNAVRKPVSQRVAFVNNTLYYAISPEYILAVRNGKIFKYSGKDIYFYYNQNFCPQCLPDFNSKSSDLPKLVKKVFNISDEYLLCFLAELCTFFLPNINNPILVLSGGQGTSKSTTSRKIKALVDPANSDIMSIPEKEDGLYASLSNSYIVAYDNIATISNTYSDILCTAVTHGTAVKRKLYSDNTLHEIKLHTNIILNGIENIVKKTDLAERCNTIYLEPITTRLTDSKVKAEFESIKAKLLGSIFDTIRQALTLVEEMSNNITDLPRMADFAVYGAAVIKAIGLDYNEFLNQYIVNTKQLIGERAKQDSFVILIKKFLDKNNNYWKGSSKDLLEKLTQTARTNNISLEISNASALSRKLTTIQTNLEAADIIFERGRDKDRYIELSYNSESDIPTQFNIKSLIDDSDDVEYTLDDFSDDDFSLEEESA